MKEVWLITGCSTGLGRELAKEALRSGRIVVLTARNIDDVSDFIFDYPETAFPVQLDVTKIDDIQLAIEIIKKRFGKIDVLINNAGTRYLGAAEESEEKHVRYMFDVNFFGLTNIIKEVLPMMRQVREGYIINISSIAGLVGFAGMGFYSATKFAVEGYSEALASEIKPLGIKVMIVALSGFKTNWEKGSKQLSKLNIDDYKDTAGLTKKRVLEMAGQQIGNPNRAAVAIIKAIETKNPPLHLLLGAFAVNSTLNKINSLGTDINTWKNEAINADNH